MVRACSSRHILMSKMACKNDSASWACSEKDDSSNKLKTVFIWD